MKYISTRGAGGKVTSAQAIKQGLAGDGGLFMPEELPILTEEQLEKLISMSYPERAAYVMSMFLGDEYTYEELLADCSEAYKDARFPGGAAPLSFLGDKIRVLELWHGPTSAFKDMALQIMPKLLSRALKKTGEERTAYILVATSGDTGKAALEGYRDVDRVKIMVYYPVDGVSRVQKLQMATQEGNNVSVCSVKGNFDDTQNGVKKIFSDKAAAAELDSKGYFFSSANSINWGRLVPQVVYYISAYCDMAASKDISFGEEINVCVPTGNFGNILAAYIAKCMGLPIKHFVCASNRNSVLTDFFGTGEYNRNRDFYTTTSPSMDILISSNLERLLYLEFGADVTSSYMKELAEKGRYKVNDSEFANLSRIFTGYYCDDVATADTIKSVYENYNYLSDTHTAVGLNCAMKYMNEYDSKRRMLVVSTASPYKFAPSVYKALRNETFENELDAIEALKAYTGVDIPAPLADIAKRKIRFNPEDSIEADEMLEALYKNL